VAVPPAGAQPAPGPAFGTPPPSREHELARGRGHDKNDHDKDDHRGRDDHDRKDDHGGKDDHGHGNHKGRH
jgi:hypothetical protein